MRGDRQGCGQGAFEQRVQNVRGRERARESERESVCMCLCVHVSIHFRRRGEEDAKCRIREGGDNVKWLDGCAGERKKKRKRKRKAQAKG